MRGSSKDIKFLSPTIFPQDSVIDKLTNIRLEKIALHLYLDRFGNFVILKKQRDCRSLSGFRATINSWITLIDGCQCFYCVLLTQILPTLLIKLSVCQRPYWMKFSGNTQILISCLFEPPKCHIKHIIIIVFNPY